MDVMIPGAGKVRRLVLSPLVSECNETFLRNSLKVLAKGKKVVHNLSSVGGVSSVGRAADS
ncbi:protein of unknown function [Burkholderia multivorans]